MALNAAAKNLMLTALASTGAIYASYHTAEPNAAGSNEVAGGSPAYARKALSWAAADAGAIDLSTAALFDIPAGTTVTHVGYWSAVTAGVFYGWNAVTAETFASQGQSSLTASAIDLNATAA